MNFALFDTLLEGVVALDENKAIAYCNESFSNVCEIPIKRFRPGKKLSELVEFSSQFISSLPPLDALSHPTAYQEISFKSQTGKEGIIQVSVQKYENFYVLFFRDVTLENKLQAKYRAELEMKEETIHKLDRKLFEITFLLGVSESLSNASNTDALIASVANKLLDTFNFKFIAHFAVTPETLHEETYAFQFSKRFLPSRLLNARGAKTSDEDIKKNENDFPTFMNEALTNVGSAKLAVDAVEFMALGLKGKNHPYGVLLLATEKPVTATEKLNLTGEDENLLRAMAVQVSLALDNTEFYQKSITDEMTQLFNNRYFHHRLQHEIRLAQRGKSQFGLLLLDIDHFKKFNDTYGHQTGDIVLKAVAQAIKDTCRVTDVPARYGGEEFAIIALDTDWDGAFLVGERTRKAIEALEVPTEQFGKLKVTASLGVALFPESAQDETALIECSDKALYAAKHSGRNNVQKFTSSANSKASPKPH